MEAKIIGAGKEVYSFKKLFTAGPPGASYWEAIPRTSSQLKGETVTITRKDLFLCVIINLMLCEVFVFKWRSGHKTGILEATCRAVVEDKGAAHALFWSVKGDKITPIEHYVTPERAAYLKTLRGDDKNFGTESYVTKICLNAFARGVLEVGPLSTT